MSEFVEIFGKKVGEDYPIFIIGEIGLNHNGSIKIAKKLIDIVKDAGCDCVKFQKRDVENLATKEVLEAKDERFPEFGKTYRQIREHVEFNKNQYEELIGYANKKNIEFLCTPFDVTSAIFLEKLSVRAYKLASHSLTNIPLVEHVAKQKKPTIVSTGMGHLYEVDHAVAIFKRYQCPIILMHCVSSYPTPPEHVNLRLIPFYRERYNIPIGYSGHEIGYLPTLGAIFIGANVIERHITLDTTMVGFDHKLSLEPKELSNMVRDIRSAKTMLGIGEKRILDVEKITRNKYHVSVVSKIDIRKGEVITPFMLTLKNPGTGIPAYQMHTVLGSIARQDIKIDTLISYDMLDNQKRRLSIQEDDIISL